MLLTGMRFAEGAELRFSAIDFDSDQILLEAERTKTLTSRRVDLRITPKLINLLSRMKLQAAGLPFVFGDEKPVSRSTWDAARKRLAKDFGAPRFTWHDLRRTCGTFLVCAPGVYGAASGYLTAKRLGHSMEVSERHYLGLVRDIPSDAKTLEAALDIEDVLDDLLGEGPLATVA
jgi:integrase